MSAIALINAFERLPRREQYIVAAKIGAWAEFIGERVYSYLKPKVHKAFGKVFRRRSRSRPVRRPVSRHRFFHRNSPNVIYS